MHRLIVAFLAAVDAVIAIAVGLAAILAPLTLVWVLGFDGPADWAALWPASATIWQFGHAVPLAVTLPAEYLVAAGIDPSVASFTLSLAPLAFGAFTAIFAARSGRRASRADAWITGVATATLLFTGLSAFVALTGGAAVATVEVWQAVAFPALFFAVPAVIGALATEWSEASDGRVADLRDRFESSRHGWGEVPGLIARGSAVVVIGLVALGAIATAIAVAARAGEVIALFEAAHVDAFGATAVTLAQLTYLPTLVVWAMAFIAGPGFSLGVGTSVAPAGTQVGLLPGIPVLGAVPESTSPWLLLLALLPVALGAFAGWIARSRLAAPPFTGREDGGADADLERVAALDGLLTGSFVRESDVAAEAAGWSGDDGARDPMGARVAITVGIAVVSAAVIALFAWLASGALGPGTLAQVGPQPGPVALAVGLEVVVGAAILLLAPRRHATEVLDDDGYSFVPEDQRAGIPPVD